MCVGGGGGGGGWGGDYSCLATLVDFINFRVGAHSSLGVYLNKYGNLLYTG